MRMSSSGGGKRVSLKSEFPDRGHCQQPWSDCSVGIPIGSAATMLNLKVMRLTKPSLMMTQVVTCDPTDLPGDTLNAAHESDIATVRGAPLVALTELLTLPQNFGNIFLGETFSSYISVHNDSAQVCKDIIVKADLQTSSQRLTLSGASATPVAELTPTQSIDDVVHHEVKELGTHILVCAVSYTTPSGEKMYFRKFFKFQVLKPLDVKTKFYNAESDEVYLEAQIQNITPGAIYMEKVTLEPSAQYTANQLTVSETDPKTNRSGPHNQYKFMNPLDVQQFLYCLTPVPNVLDDPKVLKGVTNIGKLDIVWKTNMGEKGRLQTSPLQRVAPAYGDLRLTVHTVPDAVQLEKTFPLTCKVVNCCERSMELMLTLENRGSSGLLWCGTSNKLLGQLAPNTSIDLNLTLLAAKPGLQTIGGLHITDTFLKRTYDHEEVGQVFVYPEFEGQE